MIARQLLKNKEVDIMPIGFIDDDPRKLNLDILGIPVVGSSNKIEEKVKELQIENIIIAIPSLKKKELNQIFQECAKTSAKTKILPMLEDIVTGKVSVSHFRDVQVEDLLGREQIKLDTEGIADYVTNKVVLVTGAGGSIGSEICRQISHFHPSKLILLGHGENSIYTIEMELKEKYKNAGIQFITEIADLQDAEKMTMVMGTYQPDVVYHAAAHKHVPLMERNPEEAVKNNIIGTTNVATAASWNGVGTFVMISTDKAVNPTSVMGATKRLAEMIVQNMDKSSKTKFVAVRFGSAREVARVAEVVQEGRVRDGARVPRPRRAGRDRGGEVRAPVRAAVVELGELVRRERAAQAPAQLGFDRADHGFQRGPAARAGRRPSAARPRATAPALSRTSSPRPARVPAALRYSPCGRPFTA